MGGEAKVVSHSVEVVDGSPEQRRLDQLKFYIERGYEIDSATRVLSKGTTKRLEFVLSQHKVVEQVVKIRTSMVQSGHPEESVDIMVEADCLAGYRVVETIELVVEGSTYALLYILVKPAEVELL